MANELNYQQARQLAEETNVPDGGFSVRSYNTPGPRASDLVRASDGYMVGQRGLGIDNIPGQLEAEQVLAFNEHRKRALMDPNNYMGGWRNPDDGLASLDVSKKYPNTNVGRARAHFDAVMGEQYGVGHLGKNGEYSYEETDPTIPLPKGSGVSSVH